MKSYLLDENKVPYALDTTDPENLKKWALGFNLESRRVDRTQFGKWGFVSTVFLEMDHRFFGEGDPILFETMAFSRSWDEQYTRRYSFWPEAVAGHAEVVKEFRKWLREHGSRNQREGTYMERLTKRKTMQK